VKSSMSRGRIFLAIQISCASGKQMWRVELDENLLDSYISCIGKIEQRFAPERTMICLDRFLTVNDLFARTPDLSVRDAILQAALTATANALKSLRSARRQEGQLLQNDLHKRLAAVKDILRKIQRLHDNYTPMRFKKHRELAEQLVRDTEIDAIRLAQEIAHLAIKADCTEELVRLETHIKRLESAIRSRKPIGSAMNFMLQECQRETNTIASKTDIADIASATIDMKEEFERMREQAQNIE